MGVKQIQQFLAQNVDLETDELKLKTTKIQFKFRKLPKSLCFIRTPPPQNTKVYNYTFYLHIFKYCIWGRGRAKPADTVKATLACVATCRRLFYNAER
jgi:hypothetical protein